MGYQNEIRLDPYLMGYMARSLQAAVAWNSVMDPAPLRER